MKEKKRTQIFPAYEKSGGKLTDFFGWELPMQFSPGIIKEHKTVRENAGLFDISHMGEILVKGEKSVGFLQKLLTNDLSRLYTGAAQYTFLCNKTGGTIDDLIVYMLDKDTYLLVVNAANTEKDVQWLMKHATEGIHIENQSSLFTQLALQGPKAESILQKLVKINLQEISFFRFEKEVSIKGIEEKAIVSRTGYTGEEGFEIYIPVEAGLSLWEKIMFHGEKEGIQPAGLGARDTLRLEAGLPLYGRELNEDISPLEAGIDFAVKLNKESDFIGRQALRKQKEEGLSKKIVGIEMIEKGIPRNNCSVFSSTGKVGTITTGTHSPTLKKNIGLALIDSEFAKVSEKLTVEVRGKQLEAQVVEIPFYRRA